MRRIPMQLKHLVGCKNPIRTGWQHLNLLPCQKSPSPTSSFVSNRPANRPDPENALVDKILADSSKILSWRAECAPSRLPAIRGRIAAISHPRRSGLGFRGANHGSRAVKSTLEIVRNRRRRAETRVRTAHADVGRTGRVPARRGGKAQKSAASGSVRGKSPVSGKFRPLAPPRRTLVISLAGCPGPERTLSSSLCSTSDSVSETAFGRTLAVPHPAFFNGARQRR
jgi:hypothetical protein